MTGSLRGLCVFALLIATAFGTVAQEVEPPPYDSWTYVGVEDLSEIMETLFADYILGIDPDMAPAPEDIEEGESALRAIRGRISPILLSPDGTQVLAFGRLRVRETHPVFGERPEFYCIYTIDTQTLRCELLAEEIRPEDEVYLMRWSPDGSRIIFHQDHFNRQEESDLWEIDVETLAVTNITDDGSTARLVGPETEGIFQPDFAPTFDPNTGDLYFFRSMRTEEWFSFDLYIWEAGAEAPEMLYDLSAAVPEGHYWPPFISSVDLSPDGTQMTFLTTAINEDLHRYKVWQLDLTTGDLRVVFSTAGEWLLDSPAFMDGALYYPIQIVWLPDGERVLVFLSGITEQSGGTNLMVLNMINGDAEFQFDYAGFESFSEVFASDIWQTQVRYYALISPDGGTLIYPTQFGGFYTQPIDLSAPPAQISTVEETIFPIDRHLAMLRLAPNGRVLMRDFLLTFDAQ